jgi:hypothetical protein
MFLVLVVEPVEKWMSLAIPLKRRILQSLYGCGRHCGKETMDIIVDAMTRSRGDSLSAFSTRDIPQPVEKDIEVI